MNYEIVKNDSRLTYSKFCELECNCFDEPYNEAQFMEAVGGDYWTARSDGVLAGFAEVGVHSDRVHLGRLEVYEKFRCAGIGGALIDCVISFAEEKSVPCVTLTVRTNNRPAYALYLKKGFRAVGQKSRFTIPFNSVPDIAQVEFVIINKKKNTPISFRVGGVEIGSGIFNYEIGGCRDVVLSDTEKYLAGVLASIKPNLKPGSEYIYIMTSDAGTIGALRNLPRAAETGFTEMKLIINH
jgi:GNAT superfamily N-acetyltransferase